MPYNLCIGEDLYGLLPWWEVAANNGRRPEKGPARALFLPKALTPKSI